MTGRALLLTDRRRREAAVTACSFVPGEDHTLVEFGLEAALWAHYSSPPSWPPVYRRWKAG